MRIVLAGALGEVGSSLSSALRMAGHEVFPATSRSVANFPAGVLSLTEALEVIAGDDIDLVVNAAGPGDRRAATRDVLPASAQLAAAAAGSDVPAVLISTLRVCEGVEGPVGDDTAARPLTSYGYANAEHELAWLGYSTAMVLRMANYFCAPQTADSPQSLLLPWSLLSEGWATGHIGVRSGAQAAKTFVSDVDVAGALALMAREQPFGRCLATLPGAVLSMEQLVSVSLDALAYVHRPCTVSFGSDDGSGVDLVHADWLSGHGWVSTLCLAAMEQQMRTWLVQWGSDLPSVDESR